MKPCSSSQRNVPPGGSMCGFVQYTPDIPGRSWPPNAYSLFKLFMTTPVWRRELPINQRAEASVPGFALSDQHGEDCRNRRQAYG